MKNKKPRICIVASLFNQEYVDGMLDTALKVLKGCDVHVVRVPGAFEIPLAIQRCIAKHKPQVAIALGLIWKGKTMHADLMSYTITDALMRISLEKDVPIIHQVLTVQTETEAKARCFGKNLNRGREAAEAVLYLLEETKK